jgi:cyanophycinase
MSDLGIAWKLTRLVLILTVLGCSHSASLAGEGTLIVHGGGNVSNEVRDRFFQIAGGKNARLLVISTADPDTPLDEGRLIPWRQRRPASLALFHAPTREIAEQESFAEPIKRATGVWIGGGWQGTLAGRYLGTPVERELSALLARGGVIGGTSAGAAVLSRVMLLRDQIRTGFDLCPQAVVDQHFLARAREGRLLRVLSLHPHCFGIGVDEDTAAIIRGNTLTVLGSSLVSISVPPRTTSGQWHRLKSGDTFDLQPLRASLAPSATATTAAGGK